jgi:hypothetical protein
MLSVDMPSMVILSVIMLSVIMLSDILLSVIVSSAIMQSAVVAKTVARSLRTKKAQVQAYDGFVQVGLILLSLTSNLRL